MARAAAPLLLLGLASASPRSVLLWLVPYGNLTSVDAYMSAWGQLPADPRYIYAGSAYALKANNASLGYATTPAGEASFGVYMEQWGFPALRRLGINSSRIFGMVYVTHSAAIAQMLSDPGPFTDELLAKAAEQDLGGFDIDYEPQAVAALGADAGASFMAFLTTLARRLAAAGRGLTVDISGCPASFAFDCAGLANPAAAPGLLQVNCEDSFGAASVADIKALERGADGTDLGTRWAPGFEPGNIGQAAFGAITKFLAGQAGVRTLASWAVHEWNVGPQPPWLFAGFETFLNGSQAGSVTPPALLQVPAALAAPQVA